jgi:hypothetical protein
LPGPRLSGEPTERSGSATISKKLNAKHYMACAALFVVVLAVILATGASAAYLLLPLACFAMMAGMMWMMWMMMRGMGGSNQK